jgi:hypothetical protein
VEIAEALGGLATLPYIAGSHPLAEKFVCCHFGDSFRHLPFVHGNSLANHFDGSFLIGFICKEIPHNSRSSLGIESRNPHVPTCCHLRTVYSPALTDLFNWRTPALADNNTDYYPVPLSADTLRPGTVYADPYGHAITTQLICPGHMSGDDARTSRNDRLD